MKNFTTRLYTLLLLCCGVFTSARLQAQQGQNDASYNTYQPRQYTGIRGADDVVWATAVAENGQLIVAGSFSSMNGFAAGKIARLHSNGLLDETFNSTNGANNSIYAVAQQSDGKILIGGEFTAYDGTPVNGIARLNTDGTLDTAFNNGGSGAGTGIIFTIAVQPDGKILVGGENFSSYNGTPINGIVRLNSNGSRDAGFNSPATLQPNVYACQLLSNGKILIGGANLNGSVSLNAVLRLEPDGSIDPSFNTTNAGTDGTIWTLAVQPDGKILVGGDFFVINNNLAPNLCRLDADGVFDVTYNNVGLGPNGTVWTVTALPDGRSMVAGSFTTYNNGSNAFLVCVASDGTEDFYFENNEIDNEVYATALQPDGNLLAGGLFDNTSGSSTNFLTRLKPTGQPDATFAPIHGPDGPPVFTLLQPDDKIITSGFFSAYNGVEANQLVRLNGNGTVDSSFNAGQGLMGNAMANIIAGALQPDGKIIIAGAFDTYDTYTRNKIARLNSDGSLDISFDPGTGADANINAVVLQSDGKIIIAGEFTSYNGNAANHVARLNSDGSIDNSFNTGTGTNGHVWTALIQPDDKVILGGYFDTCDGHVRHGIARLNTDGSTDAGFDNGTIALYYATSLALQSDGKLLLSGYVTDVMGDYAQRVVRLNSDGTPDASFAIGSVGTDYIGKICLLDDERVIVAGSFTVFNGNPAYNIICLDTDGSVDTEFDPGPGADGPLTSAAVQSDGRVVMTGFLDTYYGATMPYIARTTRNGLIDFTFNEDIAGASGDIHSAAMQPDDKVIIAGNFNSFNAAARNHIARLHTNGRVDDSFDPGAGANDRVHTVQLQPDGKILAAGLFTKYNSTPIHQIARINSNGSIDGGFNPGTGAAGTIDHFALQSSGKIIVAGSFSSFNGAAASNIARLNADGSVDGSFNSGTGANNQVTKVLVQPDDKIIISGSFTEYNGMPRYYLARLNADGSPDAGFVPGGGPDFLIKAMVLQPDGKLLIGGGFTSYDGTARIRIARINNDGSLDNTFDPGTGADADVLSVVLNSDDKIIIGGLFTDYNGTPVNRLAKLNNNGTIDGDFTPGTGANGGVNAIAIQSDHNLVIGGDFSQYSIAPRTKLARVFNTSGAALPLQLLAFSGYNTGSSNRIEWQTANELHTKNFMVERSTNGRLFTTLTSVNAKGNGNNNYYYDDKALPPGKLYYRLRMADADGRFSFSHIIVLGGIYTEPASLYPNPAVNFTTLQVTDNKLINTKAVLTDINGHILQTLIIKQHFTSIGLSNYAAGVYFMRMQDGTVLKILKQ
jgi:uncharacterized delta-60 repeat protein